MAASTTTTLWRIDAGHRGRPPHQSNEDLAPKGVVLNILAAGVDGPVDPMFAAGRTSEGENVRKSLDLGCSLKVNFLRNESVGSLITQADDLDNRIKTLFDALRMPCVGERKGRNVDPDSPPSWTSAPLRLPVRRPAIGRTPC